ncbi:MAG: OadG family protein [Clostridia bacterium]|nr:OadG family protein [Clostridia bacterium]
MGAAAQAAQNDGEIIAVLTAAVHAARAENGETGSFRVVSFRRR